jgi:hypothetical protein
MLSKGTMVSLINEGDITRRNILKKIEQITKTKVIAYLANPNASPNFIDHNDPVFLNDLLECVGDAEVLDVIIDSPGGEANIAEKLAIMCREHCKTLRAIVPNSAKSAATMWAIASDKILMGYLSEIGPIDPQIRMVDPQGRITFVPAQSLIDGVLQTHQMLQSGIDQRIVIGLIQKLDPAIIDVASKAIEFSKQFAQNWLSQYMLKDDPNKAKEVAEALSDNRRWLSHGKRIGIKEAQNLGLKVEPIDRKSKLWKLLWEYYGRTQMRMNATGTIKLFECDTIGLNFAIGMQRIQSPQKPQGSMP